MSTTESFGQEAGKSYKYVYDDFYTNPNLETLYYSTTKQDGYLECKSNPKNSEDCSLTI